MLAVSLGIDSKPIISYEYGVVEMEEVTNRNSDGKGDVASFRIKSNYSMTANGHVGHPIGVPTILNDGSVLIPMNTGLQLWSDSRPSFFYTGFGAYDGVAAPAIGADGMVLRIIRFPRACKRVGY